MSEGSALLKVVTTEPSDNAIFMSHAPEAGQLLLIRHGEQVWPDRLAPVGEWVDPPLSELGQRQAVAVGTYLKDVEIDAIYSSTLERAKDTASAIASHHTTNPVEIKELEEIRMFSELPQDVSAVETLGLLEFAQMHDQFGKSQKWDSYLHGERSTEFRERISQAIQKILDDHKGSTVAIVCHGGVKNIYLSHLLGLEPDMFFRPNHCSVSRLRFDDNGSVIETLNEHLFLVKAGLTNSGKPSWQ